jgi:hypothetical protein
VANSDPYCLRGKRIDKDCCHSIIPNLLYLFTTSPMIDPVVTRRSFQGTQSFFKRHKVATIVVVSLFLFYWWNAIRPANITNGCMAEAAVSAKVLLQNKAEVTADREKRAAYESMVSKGMYLRSDYESYYKKCLRTNGVYL